MYYAIEERSFYDCYACYCDAVNFIGSLKFQEYQNKKSEEKILNIALVNESGETKIRDYILNQKGVNLMRTLMQIVLKQELKVIHCKEVYTLAKISK